MNRTIRQKGAPSAGTVLGAIGAMLGLAALIVSLSTSAVAASHGHKVGAKELAPGAVTARAIAHGAVRSAAIAESAITSKKLADGSVNRRVLKGGAVTTAALAPGAVTAPTLAAGSVTKGAIGPDAVTKGAIAPGSVYGGALTGETIHLAPITDVDAVAENGTWTAGNSEIALCAQGEALLGTGFAFTEPGNREVAFLQAAPFLSSTGNGVSGRITSNSGGTAKAQVMAICLGG